MCIPRSLPVILAVCCAVDVVIFLPTNDRISQSYAARAHAGCVGWQQPASYRATADTANQYIYIMSLSLFFKETEREKEKIYINDGNAIWCLKIFKAADEMI